MRVHGGVHTIEGYPELTAEQMEKLDFFLNELLFDGDDEDHIPEFTTDFDQVDISQSH